MWTHIRCGRTSILYGAAPPRAIQIVHWAAPAGSSVRVYVENQQRHHAQYKLSTGQHPHDQVYQFTPRSTHQAYKFTPRSTIKRTSLRRDQHIKRTSLRQDQQSSVRVYAEINMIKRTSLRRDQHDQAYEFTPRSTHQAYEFTPRSTYYQTMHISEIEYMMNDPKMDRRLNAFIDSEIEYQQRHHPQNKLSTGQHQLSFYLTNCPLDNTNISFSSNIFFF